MNLKNTDMVNFDPTRHMPDKGALEKLNQPFAREHAPHVSADNKMTNYETSKPSLGKLGARGQATGK
jgi:hypothetical protein|tara:strand:- start:615 stop:815 length:201 start_codon:yes stop_codon:yes gene_type:complete